MDKKVKNKKLILYTSLEIIVLIIMTVVGNMWDWVNMQFRPDLIATGGFWEDTMIKSVLYSGSLVLAILLKLSKLELKDTRYDELLNLYHTKWDFKEKNTTAFSKYIDKELNPRIKKEYIRTMLNAKLLKIQKHEKDEWLSDYFKVKDLLEENPEFDYMNAYPFCEEESKNYFIKRTRIEAMLEPEFLDKHYLEIRCKYPRVSTVQFGYYLDIRRNRDDRYKLDNEVVKDVSKQAAIKVIFTFFISFCLTIMMLQPSTNELLEQANGWIILLIKYIIRVTMICLSFATGLWTAKTTFNDNYLLPLLNRNDILDDFALWLDIHPVKELGVAAIKEQVEKEVRLEYEEKLKNSMNDYQKQVLEKYENLKKEETKGTA